MAEDDRSKGSPHARRALAIEHAAVEGLLVRHVRLRDHVVAPLDPRWLREKRLDLFEELVYFVLNLRLRAPLQGLPRAHVLLGNAGDPLVDSLRDLHLQLVLAPLGLGPGQLCHLASAMENILGWSNFDRANLFDRSKKREERREKVTGATQEEERRDAEEERREAP